MNIIYMHSKNLAPAVLSKRVARLVADAQLITTDTRISVRPSKVDFERNFTGDWSEWAEGISTRRDATTRKFVYDAIVTDLDVFGKATTDALRAALLPGGQARVSVTSAGVKVVSPILVYHWTPAPDRDREPEEGFDFGKFRKLRLEDIVIVDEQDYVCTATLREEEK